MFKLNALKLTDAYKLGHADQYPYGTQFIYSNGTARSDYHFKVPSEYATKKVVWFGMQAVVRQMHELWENTFFDRDFDLAASKFIHETTSYTGAGSFSRIRLRELWEYGSLPIIIKALPEGSRVDIKVPFFTIANTDERFYWITNYLESYISSELWLFFTSATIADRFRAIADTWYDHTGADKTGMEYSCHDFSMRGMSSAESACKSGAGHLLSFSGTDTIFVDDFINYYYPNSLDTSHGASVPATEHSVMCAGGQVDERETFRRLINDVYPTGIVSIVSDTWDFWNVCTNIVSDLKVDIITRDGKVVLRPESGDPVDIICGEVSLFLTENEDVYQEVALAAFIENYMGYGTLPEEQRGNEDVNGTSVLTRYFKNFDKWYKMIIEVDYNCYDEQLDTEIMSCEEIVPTPTMKGAAECLWDVFGGTVNKKNFRELDSHIGLIYGDSITMERQNEILKRLAAKNFAASNIVFGVGSFSYQMNSRDTFGFAMKATWSLCNGKPVVLEKNPVTDNGIKKSAKGLLRVEKEGDKFVLYDNQTLEQSEQGELRVIYDEQITLTESFQTIRNRLKA